MTFRVGDGTGGKSAIRPDGGSFADETGGLKLSHDRAGLLSMANSGPNTNKSQFFITLKPCKHLDGIHVIFGEVIEGMSTVMKMGNIPTVRGSDKPIEPVRIIHCGVVEVVVDQDAAKELLLKLEDDQKAEQQRQRDEEAQALAQEMEKHKSVVYDSTVKMRRTLEDRLKEKSAKRKKLNKDEPEGKPKQESKAAVGDDVLDELLED
eukprot:c14026_g1_i3.p1 GENE.c14026_g1_i3~~c14026_g1_i3.p1  ORF type:complete len:207 (+),score=43.89 c14026_g1_i3:275-895(+)